MPCVEFELNFYNIDQDIFESDYIFYERVWFILSNIGSSNLENLEQQSKIMINKKYLNCTYLSSGI